MPPTIVSRRVQELHASLVEAGWVGKKLPRGDFERFLARDVGLSLPNIRVHIDMGRALGLWELVVNMPRQSELKILPPATRDSDASAASA